MLSRARRGVCEIVAGAALWRCRCEIVAGAALWRCRCRSRGRRSILCIWVCVCVAGVAFGSCLEGQDVVARARRGVCEIVAGAALWRCRCEIVAGAALWRCRCRSRGRRCILCIWVLCNRIHTRGARYMCVDIWEKHSMWGYPVL